MNTFAERTASLQQVLAEHRLNAYLIPSSDPHQSEYVAPRWQTRAWLSGFTGSAGTLVVTPDEAGLWTDSRYFLQADTQLAGTGIVLQKQKVPHAPEHIDWLARHLPAGGRLGFDGQVVSLAQARALENRLAPKGIALDGSHDLPGKIWKKRPERPRSPIMDFPATYAGQTRGDKLGQLRQWMQEQDCQALLLVALDDIAWTLNIRAADVDFNPVCLSYLIIDQQQAYWCVDEERVAKSLRKTLASDQVSIHEYQDVEQQLLALPADARIAVDPATLSYQLYEQLRHRSLVERPSPVQAMKAIKNATEIGHLRQAMRKDGVALVRLFRWLEETLKTTGVTEVEVAERLEAFRREQDGYQGESFAAIVGYQANGAIVHYRAEPDSCATLKPEGVLLLDSGGQYLEGTTDITRTVALGDPTMEQRRHFTLVLKGMIALTRARFPRDTSGAQLDTLARQFLWQEGLNYGHGTGHGVGFFLNVHEGPQGFATSAVTSRGRTAFEPGMVTSNEPGFYRTGRYGIRTENLILCVEDKQTEYGDFLRFETLTLFPIDRRLIQQDMLTPVEREWLNDYHSRVHEELAPLLQGGEKSWVHNMCRPL
jgi:Xaa-Pro aminopeptidase